MTDLQLLGPWVRRFLLEYLVGERNLARNTQRSYRDAFRQLLPFVAQAVGRKLDALRFDDLSADRVRDFLRDVEETRRCGPATRNQRLAAVHSFAEFVARHCPEQIAWCGQLRNLRAKKTARPLVGYLEKDEMEALLAAPDRRTPQGRRDFAVLLFLYNSGARADELAHVRLADLALGAVPERDPSSVLLHGKGGKQRRCPLWPRTAAELLLLVRGRAADEHVFLNRRGEALTRFGVHAAVERHAATIKRTRPALAAKRISPHLIRHTTATHLLRAGVDINTIRAWLGHVSLATTMVYAEVDLEMKAKALANCAVEDSKPQPPWRKDADLMAFLKSL